MNETECENLIKSVKWTEPSNLISLAILEFINVLVISGNLLVIAAVFCSNKLRSVTNFFIVNLAIADLLVGLAVLPFSATWEVFKVWIFGDLWCRIWLAVDVWMCTASILNLCAISLDRYVAVTRPVTYPSIMSKKRAKSLIAGIWVLSFVICFPPLVGWKDQKHLVQSLTYTKGNHTLIYVGRKTTESESEASVISAVPAVAAAEVIAPATTESPTSTAILMTWSADSEVKLNEESQHNLYDIPASMPKRPPAIRSSIHIPRIQIRGATSIERTIYSNDYDIYNRKVRRVAINDVDPIPSGNSDDYMNDDYTNNDDDDDDDNNRLSTPLSRYNNDGSASSVATIRQFNHETQSNDNVYERTTNCPWKCELTNDRGYVLYSALGSFYIPMFIMLFFYWRIYRAAVRTTRAINQGFKTTKGSKSIGSRFDEQRLTLRIHRGRGSSSAHDSIHSNGSTQSTTCSTMGTPSPERLNKVCGGRRNLNYAHEKIKISVSYPSNENIAESNREKQLQKQQRKSSACSSNTLFAPQFNLSGDRGVHNETQLYRNNVNGHYLYVNRTMSPDQPQHQERQQQTLQACRRNSYSFNNNKKMGKRNIRAQVKKFRMETKAAKTLAIIVGLFILCWLPFFTIYIIRPFCNDCIDPLLFSVLFWLGYCNSAVNPMIYALFSKDFRFAFKSLICRCFCSDYQISNLLRTHARRESDLSAGRIPVRTPSITNSAATHSIFDDSEHQTDLLQAHDNDLFITR